METPKGSTLTVGIILAGGAGTRLGGVDKGLINVNGRPLVEYVLERLEPQVDRLLIVANRHQDSYAAYGHPVISDSLPGFAGPLAGMLTGIRHSSESFGKAHCLFVPVDAPILPGDLYQRLHEKAGKRELAVAGTHDGLQPVCCLIGTRHLDKLEKEFDQGERSPQHWLKVHRAPTEDFSDITGAIWSLNTPADLQMAQRALLSAGDAAA